jgi:hypothetical protein
VDEVPREEANLEAEGGETAFGPITGQSIPDHLKIKGKRHTEGGVPLNLPDDTFIFSDTASLRINDPSVLAMFNKTPKKGGYTPAEIAKPYNINKYKSILLDPDTSRLERDTATIMIKNYIMKLGSLALVQESMKGFPQGIPEMAKPYMEANGIAEEDLMPELKEQADALEQAMSSGQPTGMQQGQNPMAAQEMQQMDPEQAMQADQAMMNQGQGQPSYPQQMPSGAPVASPEMMQQMAGQGSMPPPDMMQEQGMMQYGGMPYAAYGMEMGGYDFPYDPNQMAMGGMPKFSGPGNSQVNGGPGGPGGPTVTVNNIAATRTNAAPTEQGWTQGTPVGATGQNAQGWSRTTRGQGEAVTYHTGSGGGTERGVAQGICSKINKSGNIEEAIREAFPAYLKGKRQGDPGYEEVMAAAVAKLSANPLYKDCITAANAKFVKKTAVFMDETEPEKKCPCEDENGNVIEGMFASQDENGNCLEETCGSETETLMCKCVDPVTGAEKEFPIENEEQCVCQDGSRGQAVAGGIDSPHLSKRSRMDIARNASMKTGVARDNVVLPGRAQIEGAYEEYQTKVDTAQSAVNAMQNAVMNGMAGSTASKQVQMKDLLGKSLRASIDAVAGVQSRNVDRQRETNVQKANIDNANISARTLGISAALSSQKDSRNQETVNENRRLFNTMGAGIAGADRMAQLQQVNKGSNQFNADYENEFVYNTGVQKPFTGAGSASLEDRTNYYLGKTGDYDKAFEMAYKEGRLNKTRLGGQRLANGGYVLASNVYPFIL